MSERCPKCGNPKIGDSCPKCGLVFDKFDPAVLEEGVSEEVRNRWEDLLAQWDDDAAHAVFIERSLLAGDGAFAASCYRKKEHDPKAQEYLERITKRMAEHLLAQPRVKRVNPTRARIVGIVLIIIVLIGISWLFQVLTR